MGKIFLSVLGEDQVLEAAVEVPYFDLVFFDACDPSWIETVVRLRSVGNPSIGVIIRGVIEVLWCPRGPALYYPERGRDIRSSPSM